MKSGVYGSSIIYCNSGSYASEKKSYIVKIIRMPSVSVKFLIDDMLIKIKIRTVYQYEETNPSMKSEVNGSSIKTLSLFAATLSVM